MPLQVLEEWLRTHLPEAAAGLNAPVSEASLAELQAQVGVSLPDELLQLYRWHDGQIDECTGIFYGLSFMPLARVLSEWHVLAKEAADEEEHDLGANAVVRSGLANRHWIPFAEDRGGNFLAVDLMPGPAGCCGQVINFGRDEILQYALAPDVLSFIAWMNDQLKNGNFIISEGSEQMRPFDTREPKTSHFLDSSKIIFGGVKPRKPKPSGPLARDSTPGVLEFIRTHLSQEAPQDWVTIRLRATIDSQQKVSELTAQYSVERDGPFEPFNLLNPRVLEVAVLELQQRTAKEKWEWSKITLDYTLGESQIQVDAE